MSELIIVVEHDGDYAVRVGPMETLGDLLQSASYSPDFRVVSVNAVDRNGQVGELELSIKGAENFDRHNDMAYPVATVTWPTGESQSVTYSVDGRA